ncbi:hypothetical protein BHYA_0099g00220 [Botrytis hyacinthi]|uniref:Sugar phosphate transporter domain-containing protein n=1 Tax=Botrytis hyacinthi TaxID=278943 RepID=A0A4Z1GVA1_9HELO|nr:hypothetical protein BHYA_0099g00220 [Botrytis hyacinthi]
MNPDLPPNAAWAANAFAPRKKEPTIFITTKNGHSTFGTPAPALPTPANTPPAVAPPKRNNGTPFSMAGSLYNQQATSSPAPVLPTPANTPPAMAPPKRNNGTPFSMVGSPFNQQPTPSPAPAPHVQTPYVPSSFLPPTAAAAPIPYGNLPPYTPSTTPSMLAPTPPSFLPQVPSAPAPAPTFPASSLFTFFQPPQVPSAVAPPAPAPTFGSAPFSFSFAPPVQATAPAPNPVAPSLFSSASFVQPAPAQTVPAPMPLPPFFLPSYAQQQPPSPLFSPVSAPIQFCPHRPAAPIPAEPPSPEFYFDSENQRITEEMDCAVDYPIEIYQSRLRLALIAYPYPWLLTAWHALCSSVGTNVSRRLNSQNLEHRSQRKNYYILLFSILYTINIAVSNVSLGIMTIPDHLVIRSTIPIFVLILSFLFRLHTRPYSPLTILSLLPLTLGVLLVSHDSLTLTLDTTILCLLGALLSACKTLSTNSLQTHLSIPALTIIRHVAPLAGIQATIWSYMNGEIDEFLVKQISSTSSPLSTSHSGILLILTNGLVAFLLNWSSFTTNKKAGALTMAVLGNIKQVISIAISVVIFRDANASFTGVAHISGIILALGGGFLYSLVEVGTFGNSKNNRFGPSKENLSENAEEDIGSQKTVYMLHELKPRHFWEMKR